MTVSTKFGVTQYEFPTKKELKKARTLAKSFKFNDNNQDEFENILENNNVEFWYDFAEMDMSN
jgi:hypothetical protein